MRGKRIREDILIFVFEIALLIIIIAPNSTYLKGILSPIIKPEYLTTMNACVFVMVSLSVVVIGYAGWFMWKRKKNHG